MDTEIRSADHSLPGGTTRRRRPVQVVLAAAAITLLVVGALAVITAAEVPRSAVQGSEPVAVVMSAYDALNSGDIDLWLGHFADDAEIFGFTKESAATAYTVLSVADHRVDIVDACHLVEPSAQGASRVACTVAETNDFHGAGGISLTRTETFALSEDGRITGADAAELFFTQPGYYVFNEAFWDWMRQVHPAVFAEIKPGLTTHLPDGPSSMRTMLEYVDEFLAQSDRFPISDGS